MALLDPAMAEFWVLAAFLIFVGLLLYYSVPKLIGDMLDERANAIRKELDDARKLREDAEALLADYKRKAHEAEAEAKEIIDHARREAEDMAKDAKAALAESLARRSKLAEEKIARAEAQAIGEVRSSAVVAALGAAESVLKSRVTGATADGLVEQSIRDLKGKLN